MSQKHIPRHRRTYAKEFQTALRVQQYVMSKIAHVLPSADIDAKDLADIIGLAMGTVAPEQIPAPVQSTLTDADIASLIAT
jgi:hypothetical protein